MIDIDVLISKINIVDYIGQYADLIKKNGAYWCCSPLNPNDTDPSFEISEELQRFYDFSTEKYGGVLQFIMEYNHCNFPKAIDIAMEYCGLTEEEIKQYEPLDIIKCLKNYKRQLKEEKSTNYKILDSNYMSRYIFSEDKFKGWIMEGIPVELIQKYQIKYDGFSNCIVIPMYDNNGNIVNISNRTLYDDYKQRKIPKYIYSYSWNGGGIDILWGLSFHKNSIKKKNRVIIVEGVKSVLKLESFGYDNAVAILTSHLNTLQLKELIKCNVKEYIIALDNNVNVRKDSNLMLLKRYGKLSYIHDYRKRLKEKDSPCDGGKELFDELYKERFVIN